MSNAILLNTRGEFLRMKRTPAFWLTIISGILIPSLTVLIYIFRSDVFIKQIESEPWNKHFQFGFEGHAPLLLPLYAILVCSLVLQVEYRNNTWKQVYTSPRSYADIYFSKFAVVQSMIILSFVLFLGSMLLSPLIVTLINSKYTFLSHPIQWQYILAYSGKLYLSLLGMTAIQFWLSVRLKNYIVPVGIGVALMIVSIMLLSWENVHLLPYAHPILSFLRGGQQSGPPSPWPWSLGYAAVFLIIGYFDTVFRRERG